MRRLLLDTRPLHVSPAYRRLWWGLGLAQIGTMVTQVAVSLEIYEQTSSTFAVGILGIAALVPLVVLGLYGGALADAFDRRTVALVSGVVMISATVGLVVQAALQLEQPWVLYLLVAIQSSGSAVNVPTRMSIIPRLVGRDLLPAANALGTLTGSLGLTVGPLLGAVLAASVGYAATYALDVVLFGFALYALLRLPAMPPGTPIAAAPGLPPWTRTRTPPPCCRPTPRPPTASPPPAVRPASRRCGRACSSCARGRTCARRSCSTSSPWSPPCLA